MSSAPESRLESHSKLVVPLRLLSSRFIDIHGKSQSSFYRKFSTIPSLIFS